jgi:hypothetical protein
MQPQQYASNPTAVLQSQLTNSEYATFAAFVSKVKRLPRSSSNRLDFDDLMKALRESRLVLDNGLFTTALRQLDESRQGQSVDYVKMTAFLAQAWPPQKEIPGLSQVLLSVGPSPDDPFQGAGARAGMPRPAPTEDSLFGTPIRQRQHVGGGGRCHRLCRLPPPLSSATTSVVCHRCRWSTPQ